jgi:hypothetical protein
MDAKTAARYYAGSWVDNSVAGFSIPRMRRVLGMDVDYRTPLPWARRPPCNVCGGSTIGKSYVWDAGGCSHYACRYPKVGRVYHGLSSLSFVFVPRLIH